jgi:MYXO-CTERM domain-containing protein
VVATPADGTKLRLLDPDDGVIGGEAGLWRDGTPLFDGNVRVATRWDTAWLVASDDGLWRVDDADAVRIPRWAEGDLAESLDVRDGRLAVGAHSGAWVSDDAGDTWTLATDHDLYDDRDATWAYAGFTPVADVGARGGAAHRGAAGATAEWRVHAADLALRALGDGRVRVTVDGGAPDEITVARGTSGEVWRRALEPGPHVVHVEVLRGRVSLDGGERWRFATSEPPEAPEPGCGCRSDGSAAALVLVAALGRRRRPQRACAAITQSAPQV